MLGLIFFMKDMNILFKICSCCVINYYSLKNENLLFLKARYMGITVRPLLYHIRFCIISFALCRSQVKSVLQIGTFIENNRKPGEWPKY